MVLRVSGGEIPHLVERGPVGLFYFLKSYREKNTMIKNTLTGSVRRVLKIIIKAWRWLRGFQIKDRNIKNGVLASVIVMTNLFFDAVIRGVASEVSFFEMAMFYFIVFLCLQHRPDGGAFIERLLLHVDALQRERKDREELCRRCLEYAKHKN